MSDRVRRSTHEGIADYLKIVRKEGWLAEPDVVRRPLWIAAQPHGSQKRMSQRTAGHSWHEFLETVSGLSHDYQLGDLVLTGRVAFLKAAKGSTDLMSDHAGLNKRWAAHHYSDHVSDKSSTRDVLSQLSQKFKRRG